MGEESIEETDTVAKQGTATFLNRNTLLRRKRFRPTNASKASGFSSEEEKEEGDAKDSKCVFIRPKSIKKGTISAESCSSKKKGANATTEEEMSIGSSFTQEDSALYGTFKTSRDLNLHNDQRATARSGVDADKLSDHRAILERDEAIGKAILEGKLESGVYRGKGAYAPILQKREGSIAAGKYTGLYGPVRGTDNVRMTMRIDYDPCICKDYKETGYCGFGDTCKFLHDRTDYKAGWQIEREWEEQQKKKQQRKLF